MKYINPPAAPLARITWTGPAFFFWSTTKNRTARAAEELHISQPSLSGVIRELEEEFQVPLFRRLSKGLIPTEQGTVLLEKAALVLGQAQHLKERMQSLAGHKKGRCLAPASVNWVSTKSLIPLPHSIFPILGKYRNSTLATIFLRFTYVFCQRLASEEKFRLSPIIK